MKDFEKYWDSYYVAVKHLNLEVEEFCLMEMSEGGTFVWYEKVAKMLSKKGITRVFDIGANLGLQRYFFEQLGIQYIPVDECSYANINGCLDGQIERKYPFAIQAKSHDALISHLCVGFLVDFEDAYRYLSKFNTLVFDNKLTINNDYAEILFPKNDNLNLGRIHLYEKAKF